MAEPQYLQENTAQGIQGGAQNPFQAGINNIDPGAIIEGDLQAPWIIDPDNSWLEYQCWFEVALDPGVVVHRNMPQTAQNIDQLGTDAPNSKTMASRKLGGPNLKSVGKFQDTPQRMANSKYRFVLKGAAVRAGYQPTIPKLLEVAGVEAIPDGIQKVTGPRIIGNYSGVPVYFAAWELPYTVTIPPQQNEAPPTNLSEHIAAIAPEKLPQGMAVPISAPDSNAVRSGPRINLLAGLPREAQ